LPERTDIDIVVEVIGGSADPSKALVEKALMNRKHVVTANKALLAKHGHSLALMAEENKVALRFEAAVAGGIPIIKALTESLSSNSINRVAGVMNGTCNYILTRMESTGASYEQIFKEAQDLGFVEADPQLDVGGIDAAQKLAILSSISFHSQIDFNSVEIEGIEKISLFDIESAKAMGYRIKLIGTSQLTEDGLYQEVQPCLVPESSALSKLEGGTNMVIIDSDFIGQTSFCGPGAGGGPTASAIVSDIIDIARGNIMPVFGIEAQSLKKIRKGTTGINRCYYLRLSLVDKPGALGKVAAVLGENKISIDRMRQKAHAGDEAPLLIVTHETTLVNIKKALFEIDALAVCLKPPVTIKIEEI
jgi:homoserine dehydrogenase